jgi:hypothetical protein
MSQNFILEQNVYLNARINIFPDTHLLMHGGNQEDLGDPSDLELQEEFSEDGEDEEDEEDEGGNSEPPSQQQQPQQTVLDFTALLNANNM